MAWPTHKQRLLSNFIKKGPDDCWLWTGRTSRGGYGSFWFGRKSRLPKVNMGAHRVLYQLKYGEIPKGLLVCHKCDYPPCVNPRHLFLGTHQDNADDRERKGRCHNKGEDNFNTKLTNGEVRDIRRLSENGKTGVSLAKQFRVSTGTISHIINGVTHRVSL